jgi:hypothetical protein
MRNKMLKRQLNRLPVRIGREALAIRLPRPSQGVRPQMNAIFLPISEDVELDPTPDAGINNPTTRLEIQGDLNKSAIVLETDIAAHANGWPARDYFAGHNPFGYTTHDLVGEELPGAANRSRGWLAAHVIYD